MRICSQQKGHPTWRRSATNARTAAAEEPVVVVVVLADLEEEAHAEGDARRVVVRAPRGCRARWLRPCSGRSALLSWSFSIATVVVGAAAALVTVGVEAM